MLKKIFGSKPAAEFPSMQDPANADMAALATELLRTPSALMQLTADEARVVVGYMMPLEIDEGITFIQQGDAENTHFMVLVLAGEVMVESIVVSRTEPITVNVLGPGHIIGEMGLLDGEPRSASCKAATTLHCAILNRDALGRLLEADPRTAAKLMLAVSLRIAERLRESAHKLQMYAQLTLAMQQELDRLMPT
ncbi:MAG: cyclic nucleotide-binding domain-containing protein [Burkholderiaceae bacterium]